MKRYCYDNLIHAKYVQNTQAVFSIKKKHKMTLRSQLFAFFCNTATTLMLDVILNAVIFCVKVEHMLPACDFPCPYISHINRLLCDKVYSRIYLAIWSPMYLLIFDVMTIYRYRLYDHLLCGLICDCII